MNEKRVIVAMSGGVDSSVAAALLYDRGYDVIGITIKTWSFIEVGGAPKFESGCCSLDAIYDAKNIADKIGFPHYTVDFTKEFEKAVIDDFVDEYLNGRTPNPCVICNRKIKWEELLKKADSLDAKYIATGHYANISYSEKDKRFCLRNSENNPKDQSYALWGLSQNSLSRTIFPIGDYSKTEVRNLARKFGLKTAGKPDSQEICFVADNNYARFLRERVPDEIEKIKTGDILYHGEKVAEHKGIPFYTIGQRRGLGVALGKPVFVRKIDKVNNIIELGDKQDLLRDTLSAKDINYVSAKNLSVGEKVICKIRYSDKGSEAFVLEADGNRFSIKFLEPKSAITAGQSAVLYNKKGFVLAGGIIDDI